MILPSTILNNTNLIRIKIVKEEWGGGGGRGEGGRGGGGGTWKLFISKHPMRA